MRALTPSSRITAGASRKSIIDFCLIPRSSTSSVKPLDDAASSGTAKGGTGSALTAKEAEDLVTLHNKARKEVGVDPVKWSPTLAKHAQGYADKLARTGKWEHNPDDTYGENLGRGTG